MIKSWRKKATAIAALCLLGVLAISYRNRNPSLRAKKVATQTSRMDMKDANQDAVNIESDMIPHHIKSCAIAFMVSDLKTSLALVHSSFLFFSVKDCVKIGLSFRRAMSIFPVHPALWSL